MGSKDGYVIFVAASSPNCPPEMLYQNNKLITEFSASSPFPIHIAHSKANVPNKLLYSSPKLSDYPLSTNDSQL